MKAFLKRIIAVMIISSMVVICFGCGKSETKKETKKSTTEEVTTNEITTIEPTTIVPTTTAYVATSNKVTLKAFKKASKSAKKLHLKRKGNGKYVQKDYSAYAMGTPCDIYVYTNGKDSIKKMKIRTSSGSIKGLKAMGKYSVFDTMVGNGPDEGIPLDESEGDPRTGVYYAGWNYEVLIDCFFNAGKMKGWGDVKSIDIAKGKKINGWKVKAKEASGDGFVIVLKKVKNIK